MSNFLLFLKFTYFHVLWLFAFPGLHGTVSAQTYVVNLQTGRENAIIDFCVDAQENCYVLCSHLDEDEPEKVYVAKLNGQLEFEWGRLLSQENVKMKAKSLTALDNGNVLVLTEDYKAGPVFLGTNVFLIELNGQGDIIKNTRVGDSKYEELSLAKKLSDGRMILVGNIQHKTNFNVLLMEWVNGEMKAKKAFQIGKVDHVYGLCEHDNKLYMYGRSTFDGPVIKPFLAKLSLDLDMEQVWTFADENFTQYQEYAPTINHVHSTNDGLYVVFSRDRFSVSFLFDNGVILSPPTRYVEGRLSKTNEYNGRQYHFDEYYSTISIDNDTIVFVTEAGFGFNKIIFFNDKYIVVTENDLPSVYKSTVHNFDDCTILVDENWFEPSEHVIKVDSIIHSKLEDPIFLFQSNNDLWVESRPLAVQWKCFVSDVFENVKPGLSIYPNPTYDVVNFSKKADYVLYDTYGRKLESGMQKEQVQMGKYPQGVYLIRIDPIYFKVLKH